MKTLTERLRANWTAWGSPTDRDECVNETLMAMDCKEAADELDRLVPYAGLVTEKARTLIEVLADVPMHLNAPYYKAVANAENALKAVLESPPQMGVEKNPNPSGRASTEASLLHSGEASGPVGLGPDLVDGPNTTKSDVPPASKEPHSRMRTEAENAHEPGCAASLSRGPCTCKRPAVNSEEPKA